ncbi:hypothetical protein CEXT_295881 [Caerostris extrusa]|uniref:Uncharacterized protein n=1 Tax=Caerostris extrusa TaxID=172846 RepID=A0AAV4TDV9_CAEEX|nr:hypothetical protein CEXT_295881 [Caerostris extrusa]
MRQPEYLLGPRLRNSPVKSIVVYSENSWHRRLYTLKILPIKDELNDETRSDRQGKMLIHIEYALLYLLHNQKGIAHHHDLFKDEFIEMVKTKDD